MSKIRFMFKNPDAIYEIAKARHPLPKDEDDVAPRMEKEREEFCDDYFEYGDYGVIEIDTENLACRLVPRKEWRRDDQ